MGIHLVGGSQFAGDEKAEEALPNVPQLHCLVLPVGKTVAAVAPCADVGDAGGVPDQGAGGGTVLAMQRAPVPLG